MVKNTGCFSRELKFNSQHAHGSSQVSVTLVPGNLAPSHRHAYRQNTNEHKHINLNTEKAGISKPLNHTNKKVVITKKLRHWYAYGINNLQTKNHIVS